MPKHTSNSQPAKPQNPVKGSLRRALFFESCFLLTFAVLTIAASAFLLARSEMRGRVTTELQSIVQQKQQLFERTISKQRQQISLLAHDRTLASLPTVSDLVGFQSLVSYEPETGDIEHLLGAAMSLEVIESMTEHFSAESAFVPIFTDEGWQAYGIIASQGHNRQMIALFDSAPLLRQMLQSTYVSDSTDMYIGSFQRGALVLMHDPDHDAVPTPLYLGAFSDRLKQNLPLAKAINGSTGVEETRDHAGVRIIAAYAPLHSIGWGLAVHMDTHEMYAPIWRLARLMLAAGLAVVGFLSLVVYSLSNRISKPLEELAGKLNNLEARGWKFVRSIFTGNEVEIVDQAAFELTHRLKDAHKYLESVVRERTHELIQEHAQDDAVFQSIEYGLLVTDQKGNIVLMNAAGEQLTGWKQKRVLGSSFDVVLRIVDKDLHAIPPDKHPIAYVLKHRKRHVPMPDPKLSLFCKDGKLVALSLRVTPIMRGKKCTGAVAVFRNITDERRIDTMKSEFISLVSHQLRTPLSAIRWYLEMMATEDTGTLTDVQKSYLNEAATSNHRMVKLVDALLNVSRIELGKFALSVQQTDLFESLHKAIKNFRQDTKTKEIHFKHTHETAGHTLFVHTDPLLLQLVIDNIVSNAVKYSRPHTTIEIGTKMKGGSVIIYVTDTGIGIPSLQQKRVFEKLFRADNAKQSDTDGNGLGLYMSKIAAEAIGGQLWFESKEGKGTTFFLEIPVKSSKGSGFVNPPGPAA